jgi:folate-binding protein YgfZ
VDRSHRGVVVVEGPERLSWLHALTTQSLESLRPGIATETLVLSPQGHVEHHAEVLDDGTRTWLLVEPGAAPALVDFLDRMRFLTRVEVRDETPRWATVTLGAQLVAGGLPVALVRTRSWPEGATDIVVARTSLPDVWDSLLAQGAKPVGYEAFEALRVAAGAARFGIDTDHRTLVHEVGWIGGAVHLDKGCYRGQETVARVHNLGRPPRRLVLVHLDGSEVMLPERGTAITVDGRAVGTLTSAARHHELGPIGLALLRRSVPDEAMLLVGDDATAAIERDVSSPTAPVDLSGVRGR